MFNDMDWLPYGTLPVRHSLFGDKFNILISSFRRTKSLQRSFIPLYVLSTSNICKELRRFTGDLLRLILI